MSASLGTRDIQVGCDLGTGSDRSRDPYLVARWPSLEAAAAHLGEQAP